MDSSPERFLSIYSPKSDSLPFFIENNALLNYEKNRFKSFCENEETSVEDVSYKIIESDVENGNDSSAEEDDSIVIVSDDDIENDFWKCSPEDQSSEHERSVKPRADNLASPCIGCLSGNVSLCCHIPETSAASESFDRKSYVLGKLGKFFDITCKSVVSIIMMSNNAEFKAAILKLVGVNTMEEFSEKLEEALRKDIDYRFH
ncbi:hypothetical protein T4B_6346 [Trichinella pseudospiralis]|uniref:Uncharacterized protein n=2 Tax=Trichinella pseudospiralis TaxID=6337 RepID=A0A0V1EPA3_TRIPS|nr:hypothetical protein T4E_10177 [Trichinella pseudospiralis]KRY75512.1 hypothetical protein T4A_1018 [Trichinella pseudospiralis]KRY83285.1 hypothetical protein T4D_4657 [Trichinella pseudospiralis]KRZ23992.1 hypothetical protein T4B_6346 [Trichinella pseudospiralis]KRZ37314.1 hypothetical protein T4C_8753 [Trichinella pseudospiralis]